MLSISSTGDDLRTNSQSRTVWNPGHVDSGDDDDIDSDDGDGNDEDEDTMVLVMVMMIIDQLMFNE